MIEMTLTGQSHGGAVSVSIDKVVIQGAEFTRVGERYLLQSEVELALSQARMVPASHVERLTTLLEDIVDAADAVALEVVESQANAMAASATGSAGWAPVSTRDEAARSMLGQVRDTLREQLTLIDTFMHRLDG